MVFNAILKLPKFNIMNSRLQILMLFALSTIFILSSCRKEYYSEEYKLEGVWRYYKVKSSDVNGSNTQNLTTAWERDEIEFVLPDKAYYYDYETGLTWEGVWELERYTTTVTDDEGNTSTRTEQILTLALVHPNDASLDLRTMVLDRVSNHRMKWTDQRKYEKMRFWLEQ